jgi:LysM repeat protein
VRRGDTLELLAARHGTSIDAIRRHNGLRTSQVKQGQTLRLPGAH